jgi:gamma-glutamylcyclotransferase (GGCT)/AIG2-like uncharacterized protein YtfP
MPANMNLFAYGSLIIPEVMRRLTGRDFRAEEAFLRGYTELLVKGSPYAALAPFPDSETDGIVYYDVDEAAVGHLDRFEGADFERVEVNVETETGEWVEAQAFVIRRGQRKRLSSEPWDETDFHDRHLPEFLRAHPAPAG